MNHPTNEFLAAIRRGEPQIGMWVSLCSPYAAEVAAGAGFDWLVVDTEHAPNDLQGVLTTLQALGNCPGTALVRPAWNDTVLVKRLLDIGAPGLVFPMIQTVAEAEAAVAACRYPPRGVRGVAGNSRANNFGRVKDYVARVEKETAIIAQVESRAAMDIAHDIGAVDGIDGVFFGPADIAADMGMIGQPMAPEVWDAIRPVAKRLMDAGVPVGTLVLDPVFARQLIDEGFTFVACAMDSAILARGADSIVKHMRNG
ncbi:MAG: aldolase/citrate lyase family protein [Pseudomonadota bacterium]